MAWFRKRKAVIPQVGEANSIEIIAHTAAKDEIVAEARAVNKKLNDLLIENGFTLKIYLAAGGNHKQGK